MPGKHERWLQKTRFLLTVAALAAVLLIYGLRHFFGS
jgi:hypothetical protein